MFPAVTNFDENRFGDRSGPKTTPGGHILGSCYKKVELCAIFYKNREHFKNALGVISCRKSGFRKKIVCIIILAPMPGYVDVKSQGDSYRGVDSTAPGSFRHFGPQLFYL